MQVITSTNTLDFTNKTERCYLCKEGKIYHHTETCPECLGKKWFKGLKKRRTRCKTCNAAGYIRCEPKLIGDCDKCNGTTQSPMSIYSRVSNEDIQLLIERLDFDTIYEGRIVDSQLFGVIDSIVGQTDYGRSLKMSLDEFKEVVIKSFKTSYLQYLHLLNKDQLPTSIQMKRYSSGWSAMPIYATSQIEPRTFRMFDKTITEKITQDGKSHLGTLNNTDLQEILKDI